MEPSGPLLSRFLVFFSLPLPSLLSQYLCFPLLWPLLQVLEHEKSLSRVEVQVTAQSASSLEVPQAMEAFRRHFSGGLRAPEDADKLCQLLTAVKEGSTEGLEPAIMAPSDDKAYRTVRAQASPDPFLCMQASLGFRV